MKQIKRHISEIKLVGISVITSNKAEMNTHTAKIWPTIQRFFGEKLQNKIHNRKKPGTTFSVYTNYKDPKNIMDCDYTYFFGEEVTSFENIESGLTKLVIPEQIYSEFTSNRGKISEEVVEMWKKIWSMNTQELGGKRAFLADFEVYDERSSNPDSAVFNIYVGIKS